ncbi:MAG: tRNA glutamyl-Q(34) synthetase GluQRS, partial [Betaproteobacteria bacterium]|nr:tRNA glutamyl-Q(34) synthetase GluQRS [Betaproteobacteria bacterium]
RIEDLDPAREIPGASGEILKTLESLGMDWDGEVLYQSRRHEAYKAAFSELEKRHLLYPCICSRKEIADSSIIGTDGPVYPGTCRDRSVSPACGTAWRIRTDDCLIEFTDALQDPIQQRLQTDIGDFVLRRADGLFPYQLAVVVDDGEQGVTHVVRGADLLNSTPRQIYLQRLLGYPTPAYMHLPVAVNAAGEKLSKQTCAAPVDSSDRVPQLVMALRFLGQLPPRELADGNIVSFWEWALANWKPEMVHRKKHGSADTAWTSHAEHSARNATAVVAKA